METIKFPKPVLAVFLIICAQVLIFQPHKYGFAPGHHGWVSSHNSAIIINSIPENCFSGYSLRFYNHEKLEYDYFVRNSVLFSAIIKIVLFPLEPYPRWWVYSARQIMNIIFLLSIAAVWLLLVQAGFSPYLSAAVSAILFSSFTFVYFRDMIHYDQIAVLCAIMFARALLISKQTGNNRKVLFWGILAPQLGRGYAVIPFFVFWLFLDILFFQTGVKISIRQKLKILIRHPAVFLSACSVFLLTSAIGLNVVTEAKLRQISWEKTSVIDSMLRRSGISSSYNVSWKFYIRQQARRFPKLFVPCAANLFWKQNKIPKFLLAAFPLFLMGSAVFSLLIIIRREKIVFRHPVVQTLTILVCGASAWMFFMKNLVAFHSYTSMYYWPSALVICLLALRFLPARPIFFISAFLLFASLGMNITSESWKAARYNSAADSIISIISRLPDSPQTAVFIEGGYQGLFNGCPYAAGFFLHRQSIATDINKADFIITSGPRPGALYQDDNFSLINGYSFSKKK